MGVVWSVEMLGIALLAAEIILKSVAVRMPHGFPSARICDPSFGCVVALLLSLPSEVSGHRGLCRDCAVIMSPTSVALCIAAQGARARSGHGTSHGLTPRLLCPVYAAGRGLLSAPHCTGYEPGGGLRLLGGPVGDDVRLWTPHGPSAPLWQTLVRQTACKPDVCLVVLRHSALSNP